MRQKFMYSPNIISDLKGEGFSDEQIDEFFKNQESRNVHTKWAVHKAEDDLMRMLQYLQNILITFDGV